MKKRLLSALLALCMVLTMVPAAFAVENETVDTPADSGQADTVPDDTSTETAGITTQQALEAEIKNASDGGTVTLGSDVTITSTIKITGKNLTLDMNGKKICNSSVIWDNNDAEWSLISVGDNANLTIKGNGSFQAKANDCYAIDIVDGGRCIIEDGTFDGNISAVYVLEGDLVVNGGTFSIQQTDPNKHYAFLLNCFDKNYKNGTARITVNGGTFENFNPRACAAESTGNTTNFCASGCIVEETTQDNNKNYTVKKLKNGEMAVIPEQSEDGTTSATLDGIYKGNETEITGNGSTGSAGSTENGNVSINLATQKPSGDTTSTSLTVTEEAAASLANNGANSLTVKTNVGSVKLDETALDKMGNASEDVIISIEKVDDDTNADDTNVAAAYTVEVKSGDKNLLPEGTSNGTITITIDKPTKLSSMWYAVPQAGGGWLYVERLEYEDAEDGKINVHINHLSSIVAYSGEGDPQNIGKVQVTEANGTVEHYATLDEAISGAVNGATVTLKKDADLTVPVTINKGITLDLGGKTLKLKRDISSTSALGLDFQSGNSMLRNGTIIDDRSSGNKNCGFIAVRLTGNGTLTTEDLTVRTYQPNNDTNYNYLLRADGGTGTLTLKSGTVLEEIKQDCSVTYGAIGVAIFGTNSTETTEFNATLDLVIEDGVRITTTGFAISGNGSNSNGTNITIHGGEITSLASQGIYHPQYGTLNIDGGTVTGVTGIEMRSGELKISGDAVIVGTGEPTTSDPNGNGSTTSGAGIAVVQHTTKLPIKVNITGGEIRGYNALYQENTQKNDEEAVGQITLNVDGGDFLATDGDGMTVYSENKKDFISGGNFSESVNPEYLVSGLNYEANSGSGSTPYSYHTSIDDAIEAAGSNGTIKVIDKVTTETHTVTFDYNYDIDDYVATVVDGDTITLPSPRRSGYDFEGWYTYSRGYDRHYDAGVEVMITADVTFVADWDRQSSGGSSGGSSSSSSNRYTVSVDSGIDNGSISVSPSRAERGDTVTITIDPDEGYELDSLTVRDSRGNRIDVERQSDTRYTFEMPSGRVTVDASFTEVAETPETPDQIGSFTDVDTDDWFADAVQYMLDNGMMNGVTDTTFGPGTTTTRGMIVTILYRLEGEPDTTASSFTDAASGMYYADAVAWAQANSIVTGITETIFAPDQAITREQMAAILYRYAQYKGYDVTASNDLSSYTDASRISAYATAAMQWANAEGLITGNTSTTINPTGNATRAEVATILMRFCETVTK